MPDSRTLVVMWSRVVRGVWAIGVGLTTYGLIIGWHQHSVGRHEWLRFALPGMLITAVTQPMVLFVSRNHHFGRGHGLRTRDGGSPGET